MTESDINGCPYSGNPAFAALPLAERLEKGMQAYRDGTVSSVREASKRYGVPYTTFYSRVKELRRSIKDAATARQKITAADEAVICQHITQRLEIAFPFESHMLQETAETLYRRKCKDAGVEYQPVGLNWCRRFLLRHPDFLKTWEYYREKSREEKREAAKVLPPNATASVPRTNTGPLNTQRHEQSATAETPDSTPNPAP